MVRKVTIAAFEEWVKDDANVEEVLRLIGDEGLTLQKAAVALKRPYMCLHGWFYSEPERLARFESAKKAWADSKMDEALEIADGAKHELGAVAKAKLQVEVRHYQAK